MNTIIKSATVCRLLATAILGTLASNFAVASDAADSTAVLKETVTYGDLNVGAPQGAGTLYRRIRSAADRVCSPLDHGDLYSKMKLKQCASRAIADAVIVVNQPALIAVYNAQNHQSLPITIAQTR